MAEKNLSDRFETHRTHLRAVAHRMLGSAAEADDAVQEAWLRLSRSDATGIDNLRGWLTTVVAHVCLDLLRARKARPEEPIDSNDAISDEGDLEREALLASSLGPALLVVLETLAPAERLAFVLHDMFAVPFEEIAPIVGRSLDATRQLASRARRRIQGAPVAADADQTRRRQIVHAFLAASRGGHFDDLLALLDPQIVLRADAATVSFGAAAEVRGADGVARWFSGRAQGGRAAVVDGQPAAVWAPGGKPKVVFVFTIDGGKITGMELIGDPARIATMDLVVMEATP